MNFDRRASAPGGNEALSIHLQSNAERILELAEGTLAEPARTALQAHLESCHECHTFWLEAQRLESTLQRTIHTPSLSRDFVSNLFRQIEIEALSEATPDRLRRKADLAAEYTAYSDQLKRQFFRPSRILDVIGYALATGVVAWFLVMLSSSLQSTAEATWQSIVPYRAILVPTIVGFTIAVGALLLAAKARSAPWDERA